MPKIVANRLHKAAASKTGFETVRKLITEGADIEAPHTKYQAKPIAFAAQTGSLDTLKFLIETAKASLDASQCEHNILHWAKENTPDVWEYLVCPEHKLIEQFKDGTTYLHCAALQGDIDKMEILLTENPGSIGDTDIHGNNVLDCAALNGHFSAVWWLRNHPHYPILAAKDSFGFDRTLRLLSQHVYNSSKKSTVHDALEAIRYIQQIIHKTEDDYSALADYYLDLGRFYTELQNFDKAKDMQQKGVFYAVKVKSNPSLLLDLQELWLNIEKKQQHIHTTLKEQAKKWGFQCQETKADGSCFFHAVKQQMHLHHVPLTFLTHLQLRTQCVNFIRRNLADYQLFMDQDPEAYLQNMLNPSEYADNLVLSACSRWLNMSFVVIKDNAPAPFIIRRPNPRATFYFGLIRELHYESLLRRDDWVPEASIDTLILQADIDTLGQNESKEEAGPPAKKTKIEHGFFKEKLPIVEQEPVKRPRPASTTF